VLAGYDLDIAADSQTGFDSDYNLFYLGAPPVDGNAHLGFWNGADVNLFATAGQELQNWQAATSGDAHSLYADPRFVAYQGADAILGYSTAGSGYDGGRDDNFSLSRLSTG